MHLYLSKNAHSLEIYVDNFVAVNLIFHGFFQSVTSNFRCKYSHFFNSFIFLKLFLYGTINY